MNLPTRQKKPSGHISNYDGVDKQKNPQSKTPLKKIGLALIILLFIFSAALITAVSISNSNPDFFPALAEHFPALSSPGAPLLTQDHAQKLLPAKDYEYLKKLEHSQSAVDDAMQAVNNYHKIPWAELDKTAYADSLLRGMDICIQEENRIARLDTPSNFEQLTAISNGYISYSNQALNRWHDGSSTSNQSAMDQGLHFYEQALEKRKQYFIEFEKYLKSMGYTYAKEGDRIIYHYESQSG